jgi:multidrug efflux pump subunit AcrA (membrane-fusion protein)
MLEMIEKMKQTRWIFILIILVLTLSACGAGESEQPIPTVVIDGGNAANNSGTPSAPQSASGGTVAASGIVVPAQAAKLAFALAGNIEKVHVAEGDQVQAGDLLVELDNDLVQIEVDQAQRTVRELTSPAAIAAADQAVAAAQTAFKDAKNKVDSYKYRRGDSETIDYYKAQLVLAQKALDRAKETYNQTHSFSSADPIRATATTNLYNAQKAYNTALANLNWFTDPPSENDVALAKAGFDAASAALQEAQWYVSELKGETIPADATGTKLAQLQQARDNLKVAQAKLENTHLLAPIAGTVTTLNIVAGEYIVPGQTLIAISDVTNLQVVTTDLSERDIATVSVGQNVSVFVEALNVEITGQVLLISAIADTLGGDVVYKTTITLNELPAGIRAGMSVTVQYEQ